jgi:hypothetical protein
MKMDLDPTWSLNRTHIVDLPGLEVPNDVKGKTAHELVSAHVLTRLVRQQIAALQIDAELSDHGLHLAFDNCLASRNPSFRATADEIARTLGRNLGYVLLTLNRGDEVNRKARPEWNATHWERWSKVRRVWLGGGLVSGNLGPHIARHASQVIQANGVEDYAIRVSCYGADLALVGAARHVPPGADAVVALDFGGTRVKHACFTLEKNQITEIYRLPGRCAAVQALNEPTQEHAADLIRDMALVIAQTWHSARTRGLSPADTIPVCLAAYVEDGKPMIAHAGGYYQTNLVTDNLEAELGRQVSAEIGTSISVILLHDGSAAAAVYAGQQDAAVIVLGTALGIGFPGDDVGLRPVRDKC